ncbi:MAG: Na/Pi cotransporter family protein [Clostridiaceae bacterium]|jgi:phosphate:Na+ symporter|nr:Na/Pi cotransporter family protein [Clostridiaceae bacterium]
MTIFNILEMLGGFCLFLFGMSILNDSLTTISGGKLENILGRLSSTKFRGLLLGIVTTAVIQSSSATTVMVVALVNSGVMKLMQAVPVIMGANIGTTVTGWILSLSGISGDNFFVQMLKPSSFTPILALVGIVLIFSSKIDSKKATGHALLGFAVLMFGMQIMSGAVAPLQDMPEFKEMFKIFTNPFVGVIVGMLLTALIQSSSAFTGILQALSTTGAITFGSVIPLIMGQNIGTCITATLSSIGAGRNAKRAAFVHLSFNVIGTFCFMVAFYVINYFWPFPFMGDVVNQVNIALVHTIFNLFTTALLFPFSNQLVKFSKFVLPRREPKIRRDEIEQNLRLLDPRFLERPGFAVEQAFRVVRTMMETATASLKEAIELIFDFEYEEYNHVEHLENQVDQYEDSLMEYTMGITAGSLNQADNRKLTIVMHTLNDIERISDHAINIADQAKIKKETEVPFSDEAMQELELYSRAIVDIIKITRDALLNLDTKLAEKIPPLEDRIDEINKALYDRHIERLKHNICNVENSMTIVEIYTCFERIADHCNNISIVLRQFSALHFRTHDFDQSIDRSSPEYKKMLAEYTEKYDLPEMEQKIVEQC